MLPTAKANIDDIHAAVPEAFRAAVDLSVLADYEKIQLEGEPDLIVELIDLYLEDAPRRVAAMQESLAGRNWQLVKREAHSLQGSSGNVGAFQIAQICAEIEGLDFEKLCPSGAALLSCLELGLRQVRHAFLVERQRRSQ